MLDARIALLTERGSLGRSVFYRHRAPTELGRPNSCTVVMNRYFEGWLQNST